jgi:hypothetical protein
MALASNRPDGGIKGLSCARMIDGLAVRRLRSMFGRDGAGMAARIMNMFDRSGRRGERS